MQKVTAYANPEKLEFAEKTMYRQSFSVILDGVPTRFFRYTDSPVKCLPAGQYTLSPRLTVRADKLVLKPDFIPVDNK